MDWGLLTGASALAGTLGAIVGPWITAKLRTKPALDAALTERFTALIDRQILEREHLEGQVQKLETVASDLEIMVLRLTEWRDEVILLLNMRGIRDYPAPPTLWGKQP